MAFIFTTLLQIAVEEVVGVAAVAGATAAATYVGARTIEAVSDSVSSGSSSSPSRPSSSPGGCFGNSPFSGRKETLYYWWGNGLDYEEYQKLLGQGYGKTECFPLEELKSF